MYECWFERCICMSFTLVFTSDKNAINFSTLHDIIPSSTHCASIFSLYSSVVSRYSLLFRESLSVLL